MGSEELSAQITLGAVDEASSVISGIAGRLGGLIGQLTSIAGIGGGLSFGGFVASGIEFNKVIEDSRTGIAALVLSSRNFADQNGKTASTADALSASLKIAEGVQADLLKDALKTPGAYKDVVSAFQAAYGPATQAGITNIGKIREVTVAASLAVGAL
ncbi:MAG: hypothetical protein ABIT01_19620, partial [Thermoanaerobaculia bacterium]